MPGRFDCGSPTPPDAVAQQQLTDLSLPALGNLYRPTSTGDEEYYLRSKAHRALEHLRSLAPPRRCFSDDSIGERDDARNSSSNYVPNSSSSFRPVRPKSTRSGRISRRSAFSLLDRVSFSTSAREDDVSSVSNNFSELGLSHVDMGSESVSPTLRTTSPTFSCLEDPDAAQGVHRSSGKSEGRSSFRPAPAMTAPSAKRFTTNTPRLNTSTRNFANTTRGGRRSRRDVEM